MTPKSNGSAIRFAGLILGVALSVTFHVTAQQPIAQGRGARGQRGAAPGGLAAARDPRVQQRTYLFKDTNEQIPYALFVSSKVSKDKKNPLIVALHGLGGGGDSLLRGNALDLAEAGGFILVGPMGYNPRGWFGFPKGAGVNGRPQLGAVAGDPENLRELSEKDVMNVLELMRSEFNVDPARTYLMGHSMGGAGTFHLGVKYASNWAAIAALAPAGFSMTTEFLAPIKDSIPVLVVQGDADTAVPVDNTRRSIEAMKALKMKYEYVEIPGADHGSVIGIGMPKVFAFFKSHTKSDAGPHR
jgi:predicted peptidase